MGGPVKTRWGTLILLVVGVTHTGNARADFAGIDPPSQGRIADRVDRPSHWLVGVAFDRAAGPGRLDDESLLDDQLVGVSTTYRRAWFGGTAKLLVAPNRVSPRMRAAASLGLRAVARAAGRQWSYGVNVQPEGTLADNHWILYASPAELGTEIYVNRSLHVQLFVGARYALRGGNIDNFVVAPNGFEHDVLAEKLRDKLDAPWEGFVSLVVARRLD